MIMLQLLSNNYVNRGFWRDEAWTALATQLPVGSLLGITANDYHPPLYYLIIHFWGQMFGFSEISLRGFSFISIVLTVYAAYKIAYLLFKSRSLARQVGLLVGSAPILFIYAFEARVYAFIALLSALMIWVLLLWLKTPTIKHVALLTLIAIALTYSHYYGFFVVATGLVLVVVKKPEFIRRLIFPAAVVLLSQLFWIPFILNQVSAVKSNYWIEPLSLMSFVDLSQKLLVGDRSFVGLVVVCLSLLALIVWAIYQGLAKTKQRPTLIFLLSWLILPVIMAALVSLVVPMFYYRYLVFVAVPIFILIAYGLEHLPRSINLFTTVLVVGVLWWINIQLFIGPHWSTRQEMNRLVNSDRNIDTIYTLAIYFPEVMYYKPEGMTVVVDQKSLVAYVGGSLLEYYRDAGAILVKPLPSSNYWFMETGNARYIE